MSAISLILPAYNEEQKILNTLEEIKKYLNQKKEFQWEIIVINDGSQDQTAKIVKKFQKNNPVLNLFLIDNQNNLGKGGAVKQGMLKSTGDYCLMLDVDLSTPITEFAKFIKPMQDEIPVIIGVRKGNGAKLIIKQPWARQKMGEFYALAANLITGLNLKDWGCGFKMFSRRAADLLFKESFINKWIFDTELLYLAKKNNLSIKEIGIDWKNNPESKIKIFKDTITSLIDLGRIYLRHR